MLMFYCYILQSQKDGSFYVGYSQNTETRLLKHNSSSKGYTSTKKPWVLVYSEKFDSKSQALKREKFIKSQKSKTFIENLIRSSAG